MKLYPIGDDNTAGGTKCAHVGGHRGEEQVFDTRFPHIYLGAMQSLAGQKKFLLQGGCPAVVQKIQKAARVGAVYLVP